MSALGQRLRDVREEYGLSVEELASLAGLDSDRVRDAEIRGDLSTRELARLADGLAVNPRDLLSGDLPKVRRTPARFRASTGLEAPKAADVRLLARAQQVGRVLGHLQRLLDEPAGPVVQLRRVLPVTDPPWKQGYQLGATAREALRVPKGPIVSVQSLLEGLGVHVAEVRFEGAGIEAASLFEAGAAPVILLNARANRVNHRHARRAILAHELCHLLHDGGEHDLVTVVSRPDDHSAVEQRAGGFAPSFLAPQAELGQPSLTLPELVVDLGETWGFSYEGAVWHAGNLGWITSGDAKHLMQRSPKPVLDLRLEQPPTRCSLRDLGIEGDPSPLVKGLLSNTVARALHKEHISSGRAAEILAMS